jgi:hypothetical protein
MAPRRLIPNAVVEEPTDRKGDGEDPGDRRQPEDRDDREEDDPEDAPDDVKTVGMQRTEGAEGASDAGRRGHHDQRDEREDQRQGEPHGRDGIPNAPWVAPLRCPMGKSITNARVRSRREGSDEKELASGSHERTRA